MSCLPPLARWMLPLLLSACRHDPSPVPCNPCALEDANNYSYTASLDVDVHAMAEFQDALVRWPKLSRDIQGHAVCPDDLDDAWLVVFQQLTPDEVAQGLATDTLQQQDVTLFLTCTPSDAGCWLSDFNLFGNYLDVQQYFEVGTGTWMVALIDSRESGVKSLVFLEADASSEQTQVTIDSATAVLDATVDLRSLTPVYSTGATDLVIDWSALTVDGLGNEMSLHTLDRLLLGRFDDSRRELERDFFDLEQDAEDLWTLDVEGTQSADLSQLNGFEGISDDGLWLLALQCMSCDNPAPRFLTELRGSEGE